jgi:hypothetical protein
VHGEKVPESSRHSYWKPRPAVKTKLAVALSVAASGPDSIVTGGGMVPISQLQSAGVGSTSPSASLARTAKSCSPKTRPGYVMPDSHGE